jgi:hypothetical protein
MDSRILAKLHRERERRKPAYVVDDPLLTAAEAAAERGQAISTFRAGRVPSAYYPSPRCPRWRRSHLRAGLEVTHAPGSATSPATREQGG